MDLDKIKQLYLEKQVNDGSFNEIDQLDEVSQYNAIVTYYRSMGLDPYKLKGASGKAIRDKVKQSPSFKAWAKLRWSKADPKARLNKKENVESDTHSSTLIEVIKSSKKESKGGSKKCEVTFYGYPDKKKSFE